MLIKYSFATEIIIFVTFIYYLISVKEKKYLVVIYSVFIISCDSYVLNNIQNIVLERLNSFNKHIFKIVIFKDVNRTIYHNNRIIPYLQYIILLL